MTPDLNLNIIELKRGLLRLYERFSIMTCKIEELDKTSSEGTSNMMSETLQERFNTFEIILKEDKTRTTLLEDKIYILENKVSTNTEIISEKVNVSDLEVCNNNISSLERIVVSADKQSIEKNKEIKKLENKVLELTNKVLELTNMCQSFENMFQELSVKDTTETSVVENILATE